ncbi:MULTISPECIES: ABC transporter ATP-binding protein [unclassified Aureimonas]|uniref:ABC transporter ATP-binding protein n=1 Tax=unclassified Aureimonas TaxID=2615206 RepID=UPI0006FA2395|nr:MULTISPECIES: ATP-binding cassette domain-containing protein [unclassified Aureimonas]KQT69897.1 glycine/betaine ABC transporter ATP-binding protein [Aureimonas sp. Leaf427]KQT75949.1 glycine/betaine ABC transporter ATP-binding protein [Aureimonas sp. Leaf460]
MIVFDNVTKRYPGATTAVDGLSLVAPKGKLTVFVGPSGCGKTTSLRMINRLITPTSGSILLDGEPTDRMDVALLRRRIGYVIQHAGLFPHRTVVQNVATTARLNGVPKAKALKEAHELLERVGLTQSFADRYPYQLSGGQQQRVGVARALASNPQFMLMDEPFSAVDPVVRGQLQDEFLRLQREIGKTIIMVTHDIDEALKLGDQVAVLRTGGKLAQVASPKVLLARPADGFVADFVGRDRGYRFLSFAALDGSLALAAEPTVALGASPEEARGAALDRWVLVADAARQPLGWVDADALREPIREGDLNLSGTLAPEGSTLRHVLDAALSSPSGRGVVVGPDGGLLGTARLPEIVAAIEDARAGAAA